MLKNISVLQTWIKQKKSARTSGRNKVSQSLLNPHNSASAEITAPNSAQANQTVCLETG